MTCRPIHFRLFITEYLTTHILHRLIDSEYFSAIKWFYSENDGALNFVRFFFWTTLYYQYDSTDMLTLCSLKTTQTTMTTTSPVMHEVESSS